MVKKPVLFLATALLLASCGSSSSFSPNSSSQADSTSEPSKDTAGGDSFSDEEYLAWLDSKDAKDLNGDAEIDKKDYAIHLSFLRWRDSDEATDFTGDRKIGVDDYLFALEYGTWRNGDDAVDLNGDRKINADDFTIYKAFMAWKESADATDLNNDRKITIDDYVLFLNEDYQSFITWAKSSGAKDYDGDGKIVEADYEVYLWISGDNAKDLNDDRVIDHGDYVVYKSGALTEYEIWLTSANAKDYNGDKKIDEKDFYAYGFIGSYEITKFAFTGYDLYLIESGKSLSSMGSLLEKGVVITFDGTNTSVAFTDESLQGLGNDARLLRSICASAEVNAYSSKLVTFEATIPFPESNLNVPVSMYFEPQENGTLHSDFWISFKRTDDSQVTTNISVDLTKKVETNS